MNHSHTILPVAPAYESFVGKGFPGDIDQSIADVGVAGIDRMQTQHMIRVCPETIEYLYEGSYAPRQIFYRAGTRPVLESIVAPWRDLSPEGRVRHAMAWTAQTVRHSHLAGKIAPDRGFTEEALIESGVGWCNEQTRVFLALCAVMEIPGRLFFLFHDHGACGHAASEVLIDNQWAFVDVTFGVLVQQADGKWASGWTLSQQRALTHAAYEQPLTDYYKNAQPWVDTCPGWGMATRPDVTRGGDLFGSLGITFYLVEGTSCNAPQAMAR